jgi:hypothetical protein
LLGKRGGGAKEGQLMMFADFHHKLVGSSASFLDGPRVLMARRDAVALDNIEPFAAVINCTSSRKKVDAKARSKWAHALIFAAKYKSPAESVKHFIRRHGGINSCAAELSRLSRTQTKTR